MIVLGISCYYHDSSACLLKDGLLDCAAQEERFTRKKHDTSFPKNAIEYCLKHAGVSIEDVDHVAFYEKPFLKFERVLHQHVQCFPGSFRTFFQSIPSWINEKLRATRAIKKLGYKNDIFYIHHHMGHAASFLISPYDEAAILTMDGVGEWTTTSYGYGKGNSIELKKELKFPHSLGLLYSTITAYLGFSVNNSEYKVMGLSPYGNMDKKNNPYYEKLKKVMDIKPDGSFHFDMSYFVFHYKARMPSKKMCELLGGPIRKGESELTQRHKDIAAALQIITEEIILLMLKHLHEVTKSDNVVISGGVGLNSVANGKILAQSPFKNVWLQPDPGDGGTSVGAAFYLYNTILDKSREYVLTSASLGPEYSTSEIKEFLDKEEIKYKEIESDEELISHVANLINSDNVIGWFQGRMEWGPRALGNRSILSNAANPKMQEILNLKVKHREKFRPFAPVVCADDALDYFECDEPVPLPTDYMLMVYPIKKSKQKLIPAVTHVDGSGRLQTIRRDQNERYYNLIKKFGTLSKVPILVNTSFNIRGEPIVCAPYDAYKCMMGTGIDYLVLDRFVVARSENPRDMWDSEKYAKD